MITLKHSKPHSRAFYHIQSPYNKEQLVNYKVYKCVYVCWFNEHRVCFKKTSCLCTCKTGPRKKIERNWNLRRICHEKKANIYSRVEPFFFVMIKWSFLRRRKYIKSYKVKAIVWKINPCFLEWDLLCIFHIQSLHESQKHLSWGTLSVQRYM